MSESWTTVMVCYSYRKITLLDFDAQHESYKIKGMLFGLFHSKA